jgi:carbon storage regulator
MLVLTRKIGESILIGSDIKVSILEVAGDKVSVGIEAPGNVIVLREELVTQTIGYNIESLKPKKDIVKQLSELGEKKQNL